MTMTLEGVAADLERLGFKGYASAIRAHLTQPAQSVDVAKVREVIVELSQRGNTGFNTNDRARCNHWASKLTTALQEKGNG